MAKLVQRPARTFAEQSYIPEIVKGLGVTMRHFFKNTFNKRENTEIVTISYPEEKRVYPERFRGVHRLTHRADGSPRCVACLCCSTACPAQCIHIEAAEYEPGDKRYGYAALGAQTDDILLFLALFDAQVARDGAPNFLDPKVGQALRYYLDLLRTYSPHESIQGYASNMAIGGEAFELIDEGRVGMWFDLPGGVQIVRIGPDTGRQNYTRAIAPPRASIETTSATPNTPRARITIETPSIRYT